MRARNFSAFSISKFLPEIVSFVLTPVSEEEEDEGEKDEEEGDEEEAACEVRETMLARGSCIP